jgi:hypothetical protein
MMPGLIWQVSGHTERFVSLLPSNMQLNFKAHKLVAKEVKSKKIIFSGH